MKIKLLELFSGIGGFALGLQQAGLHIIKHQFSEIDKHAIANYKYNFKDAEYIGSVTDVRGTRGQADIITFGSPCQDFSLAGKRAGMEGQRSSLIMEAIRLISEIQPSVFIWENVKGTFSSNDGADFWAILNAFANIGNYRLEWQLLNTSWFLPQNRERIYLVGHFAGRSGTGVFPIAENDRLPNKEKATGRRRTQAQYSTALKSSGAMKADDTFIEIPKKAGTLTGGGHSGGLHSDMTVIPVQRPMQWQRTEKGREIRKENQKNGKDYTPFSDGARELVVSDKTEIGALTSQAINKDSLIGVMIDMEVANCVTSDAYLTKGERKRDENGKAVLTSMHERRIRRLTEIECERLQGFPDNWTKYGNYDGKIKPISKTQRYKMCGNAVTVKVVRAIGERLKINL